MGREEGTAIEFWGNEPPLSFGVPFSFPQKGCFGAESVVFWLGVSNLSTRTGSNPQTANSNHQIGVT